MEKVVVSSGGSRIYSLDEVNEYLEQGWTVKSVTTVANKDGMSAIFVLEKK